MLKPKQIVVDLFLRLGLLLGGALIALFKILFDGSYSYQHLPFFFVLGGAIAVIAGIMTPNVAPVFISRQTPEKWIYKMNVARGILVGLFAVGLQIVLRPIRFESNVEVMFYVALNASMLSIFMIWYTHRLAQRTQPTPKTL